MLGSHRWHVLVVQVPLQADEPFVDLIVQIPVSRLQASQIPTTYQFREGSTHALSIARRTVAARARATGGGTALPTWRYWETSHPKNMKLSGKPWIRAASRTVNPLFSLG